MNCLASLISLRCVSRWLWKDFKLNVSSKSFIYPKQFSTFQTHCQIVHHMQTLQRFEVSEREQNPTSVQTPSTSYSSNQYKQLCLPWKIILHDECFPKPEPFFAASIFLCRSILSLASRRFHSPPSLFQIFSMIQFFWRGRFSYSYTHLNIRSTPLLFTGCWSH